MEIALLLLAFAVLAAAGIIAFALSRGQAPAAADPIGPRIDQLTGRFEESTAGIAQFQRAVAERMEALGKRLGESLSDSATKTATTMGSIQTRLNVIDEAQKNIASLSNQISRLQEIFSNKQARGALAQRMMEDIISDGLPPNLYEFQPTLSNGSRPDCVLRVPGTKFGIVVDSKFPLESFEALRKATSDDERKQAVARVRTDVTKHVRDIAEKYIIAGETQTPAFMFVPSESIHAELHDNFEDIIGKANRAQVVVVSPYFLMLAMNVVLTLMKDVRMRDQANVIQREVGFLLQDARRLEERVGALEDHFRQANDDIKKIRISTDKITDRVGNIEKVELPDQDSKAPELPLSQAPKPVASLVVRKTAGEG